MTKVSLRRDRLLSAQLRLLKGLIGFTLVFISSIAHADAVWPALIVERDLFSLPAIAIGLLVELIALKLLFKLSWSRAALYDLGVNAVSTLLGVILIPLAGLIWEAGPGFLLFHFGSIGTFNPFTWLATFLLAIAITTGIEGLCLIKLFELRFDRGKWAWWALANAASVGVGFILLTTGTHHGAGGA